MVVFEAAFFSSSLNELEPEELATVGADADVSANEVVVNAIRPASAMLDIR